MRHIRIWVYDGILASGVAGPMDVFTAANRIWAERNGARDGAGLFEYRVESLHGGTIRTASGQMVAVDGPIDAKAAIDAVIVTGPFVSDMAAFLDRLDVLRPLFAALRRQHARGALIASYCSGSFVLAEAGLLDGLVATTHWAKAQAFKKRYPQVDLRIAEVMTEQNRIICSGAVTTYLNLALRLVEKLGGTQLAVATARMMLIDMNRVSQASYMTTVSSDQPDHSDALVTRAQGWMEKHLEQRFCLAELAGHLAVSERTLNRRFKLAVGESPLRYLQSLRIAVAKQLLETEGLGVDVVSEQVGYGDLSSFRQLFKRETGLSPAEYRSRFARPDHPADAPADA